MGGVRATSPPSAMPPAPLSHSQGYAATAPSSSATAITMLKPPASTETNELPQTTNKAAPKSLEPPSCGAEGASETETRPLRKHHSKKKKKRNSMNELTPLILKGSSGSSRSKSRSPTEEEVHPLPWFSSPEWPRRASPLNTNDKRRKNSSRFRRGHAKDEQTSLCSAIMSSVCCGLVSIDSEVDLEVGTRRSDGEDLETDGFKWCVQFLVGLIVVVAAVLIVMIIFQPFQQDESLW